MRTRFPVVGGVDAIRPAATRTAVAACHLGVPATRVRDVELAVHETLANALEHGHGGDARRPIDVEVTRRDHATVAVHVTDDAAGVGRSTVADPDRGHGRTLTRRLADGVAEHSTAAGTTVTLWWSMVPTGSGHPSAGRSGGRVVERSGDGAAERSGGRGRRVRGPGGAEVRT